MEWTEIEQYCKKKFAHLSNKQLVERINAAPDFGWDDEGVEINRRIKASEGKLVVKMDYDTLIILMDETGK